MTRDHRYIDGGNCRRTRDNALRFLSIRDPIGRPEVTSQMAKVALISPSSIDIDGSHVYPGGAERHLLQLALLASDHGVEVTAYWPGQTHREIASEGVRVVQLKTGVKRIWSVGSRRALADGCSHLHYDQLGSVPVQRVDAVITATSHGVWWAYPVELGMRDWYPLGRSMVLSLPAWRLVRHAGSIMNLVRCSAVLAAETSPLRVVQSKVSELRERIHVSLNFNGLVTPNGIYGECLELESLRAARNGGRLIYRLSWPLPGRGTTEPLVVFDVGVHEGALALNLAMLRGIEPAIRMEPSQGASSYVARKLQSNEFSERVEVRRAAGSSTNQSDSALFALAKADSACSTFPIDGGNAVRVPAVTFEPVQSRVGGVIDPCKLDCEGTEYDIILNKPSSVWDGARSAAPEYHPVKGKSWDSLNARLHELRFNLSWQDPRPAPELWTAGFSLSAPATTAGIGA